MLASWKQGKQLNKGFAVKLAKWEVKVSVRK